MCFERVEEYYEDTLVACKEDRKTASRPATAEEKREAARWAGNHMGVFLTWAIRRGLEGETLQERFPRELADIRAGALPGVDFLLDCLGGAFEEEAVCPALVPYVRDYYLGESFWKDYESWALNRLREVPMEFFSGWEEYLLLEPVLDRAYSLWKGEASLNFIDRALARGRELSDDEFLQAMADIYQEPEVWQVLNCYPQYVQDVIYLIDYDTEVQMEGLDGFVTGPRAEQFARTCQALLNCGAADEARLLRRAKELADTERGCGEDSFDEDTFDAERNSLCRQIALYQDSQGFWDLVRAYIGRERIWS